jgi:CRP/FNR family transcriptional regulator, anaerobic regulatory protein
VIQSCCKPDQTNSNFFQEIVCNECSLDPLCQVIEYAEPGSGVPDGILARRRPVQRGEMLFVMNQPFQAIYAVKSGSFKAVTYDQTGAERVVGFFLSGDLIGVEGMANQTYSYGVRALEVGSVCCLEVDRLAHTGRSTEVLQGALITMLGQEVAMNHLVTSSLIRQNAEQRLGAFILSLVRRSAVRGLSQRNLGLSMSRSDMASYLGLARETVSRVLSRFQNNELIRLRKHSIEVLDLDGLERVSSSD